MLRMLIPALLLTMVASPAAADPLYEELLNGERAAAFKKGLKHLDAFFKAELEAADGKGKGKGKGKAQGRRDKAKRQFFQWFKDTSDTLGVDLRTKPATVLHMLDEARAKYLNKKGFRKGKVSFFREDAPRGMSRLEYALLVPDRYDIRKFATKMPLIMALHGRATDPKHPAFRGADSNERGRQAIFNHWLKTAVSNDAIIVAPTGKPGGFKFHGTRERIFDDLQVMFRALIQVTRNYRVDSNRLYLDAQGDSIRVMCRQAFVFAGFVLRDHVMSRREPLLPADDTFLLDNLNGKPLVYVADKRNWKTVGEPTAEALKAAYKRAGKPQNLLVIQADRNPATGALRANPKNIWNHLVGKAPQGRQEPKEFKWRFPDSNCSAAGPVELMRPNFTLDISAAARAVPLSKKCGRLHYKATVVEEPQIKDGKPVLQNGKPVMISVNRIEITVTECEKLAIHLHDGVVNLDMPITVVINGTTIKKWTQRTVERDWEYFWNEILPARFFMTPYVAKIKLEFEGVPEFAPPAPPKKNDKAGDTTDSNESDKTDGSKDSAGTKAVKSDG